MFIYLFIYGIWFPHFQEPQVLKSEVEIYGYHGANDTPIRDFVFYGVTFLGNVTVTISQVELPASSVDYDPGTSVSFICSMLNNFFIKMCPLDSSLIFFIP